MEIVQAENDWPLDQLSTLYDQKRDAWVEVPETFYMEMLEVVPPILFDGNRFMVGEAWTEGGRGPIHLGFLHTKGRYFARYCFTQDFVAVVRALREFLA